MEASKGFLVLGHSSEKFQRFEERPKLPPGYTLLVLAECDMATGTENINQAVELASQTPLDFSKFRVYREGDPYPTMSLSLLTDFNIAETKNNETYFGIQRSGVYPVPLDLQEFQFYEEFIGLRWNLIDSDARYKGYDFSLKIPNAKKRFKTFQKCVVVKEKEPQKDFIEFQFLNALYPSKQKLAEVLQSSNDIYDIGSGLGISLDDLFKELGPGLYIVPSCRSVEVDLGEDHQEIFSYIEAEIYPDLEERLNKRHGFNKLAYRKQKLNLLNNLKNHPKFTEDPWKSKYESVREKLRGVVHQIENTRSKSRGRQRGGKRTQKKRKPNRR
jgi:hypothetical protein